MKKGERVYKDDAGKFYIENLSSRNKKLVKESGIKLHSAKLPAQKEKLSTLKVAVLKDGGMNKAQSHAGTKLALERLGFSVKEVTPKEVAEKGLSQYDAFLYAGTDALLQYENVREANKPFVIGSKQAYDSFKNNVQTFIDNGGKYISVGAGGAKASSQLGLTTIKVNTGGSNSNGIVKVNYEKDEVTAGYKEADLGFVYRPVWFTELGNSKSIATLGQGDFFVAGHWKNNQQAAGQSVIVEEAQKDVTLIGLEAGFRDHTDYLFRLLSNSLYQ